EGGGDAPFRADARARARALWYRSLRHRTDQGERWAETVERGIALRHSADTVSWWSYRRAASTSRWMGDRTGRGSDPSTRSPSAAPLRWVSGRGLARSSPFGALPGAGATPKRRRRNRGRRRGGAARGACAPPAAAARSGSPWVRP